MIDFLEQFLESWVFWPFYSFPARSLIGTIAIAALLVAWWAVRRRRRDEDDEARERNNAAVLCPHGAIRGRSCRPCAEEFERQILAERAAEDQDLAEDLDQVDEDLDDVAGDLDNGNDTLPLVAEGAPACTAARSRSGFIRIPVPAPRGHCVQLEISTNANWLGCTVEFGIRTARCLFSRQMGIPASILNHVQDLSSYGEDLAEVLIPDVPGIDRIQLMVDGSVVIDAPPEVLRAYEELRK